MGGWEAGKLGCREAVRRNSLLAIGKGGPPLLQEIKSEPQNRRISNVECRMSKGGIASLYQFYKIDRIQEQVSGVREQMTDGRR
jgi:hypothetical protein